MRLQKEQLGECQDYLGEGMGLEGWVFRTGKEQNKRAVREYKTCSAETQHISEEEFSWVDFLMKNVQMTNAWWL